MVTVTDSAMDKVADLLSNQPDMAGIRVYRIWWRM